MCYTNQEKSIEELILNTKELDFAKSYHEKQMKIVDAVNELMGSGDIPCGLHTHVITPSNGYIIALPDLDFLFGVDNDRDASFENVCTIEEYNQCIEEMKYHYDIPKWCSYNRADKEPLTVENSDQSFYEKETFVYGQDVYVKDTHFSNELIKFGCLTLDGNGAILLVENGYIFYPVAGISSKPIKSKEDIELEEAKRKQLKALMKKHSSKFCRPEQFESVINEMQESSDLAPIKITEEDK